MQSVDVGTIKDGDRIRWQFPSQRNVHNGLVKQVRGHGHSSHYDAPFVDIFLALPGGGTTYNSIALPLITHLNGRRVDRRKWEAKLPNLDLKAPADSVDQRGEDGAAQPVLPMSKEELALAKLTTKTRKSLDEMSESHRAHIEKWEPHMDKLGGEHVWASCNRFAGRGGDGPMYLALKRGSKDYAIVEYDTEKMAKPKVLADGFETSGQVMEAFKEYRKKAKEERASAKGEKPTKAKSSAATKPSAKKAPAKKAPAKKPARKTVKKS